MPKLNKLKTNFTAGLISDDLLGRADLKAYTQGVRQLDNMVLHATGGISKRNGSRLIKNYDLSDNKVAKIFPFMFNAEQIYVLCFLDGMIDVYLDHVFLCRVENSPYAGVSIEEIRMAQSADTLLIVHKDVAPKKLIRYGEADWRLEEWVFYDADNRLHQPYFKFAQNTVTLDPSGTSGTITLSANVDFFKEEHEGMHFRIQDKEVIITSIQSATKANATCREKLLNGNKTEDWSEPAFSSLHGYPHSICFHQDRLIIGGSRDLPNRIWGSKSVDFFNFDLGEGLDDEALEVAILSDQVNRIEAVFSARSLQIFTSGAEWVAEGNPMTPTDFVLSRESRTGSKNGAHLAPCNIEGGTIFAAKGGFQNAHHVIAEFMYTDDDLAFMSTDLTVMSKNIIYAPLDQDYDKINRRLYVVNGDGSMAVLTIFRAEKVFGWSKFTTQGSYKSVAILHDIVYTLVERDGKLNLEYFTPDIFMDQSQILTLNTSSKLIEGLGIYEGKQIQICQNGAYLGAFWVQAGACELPFALKGEIEVGLGITAIVSPLPFASQGNQTIAQLGSMRLVRAIFRLLNSSAGEIDLGQGFQALTFFKADIDMTDQAPILFSGDIEMRGLGWQKIGWNKDSQTPLWILRSTQPQPLTLLSVTSEIASYN